jgi:Phage X family
MDGFFIDKLCITQDHTPVNGELLPFLAQHRYIKVDLQTGAESEHYDNLKLEGSFSSSLMIKCNGYQVSVYGNPSRWQRIDNLYGLKTFDDCISVYNHILECLGLPVFTKCTSFSFKQSMKGKATNDKKYNGAIIKHVDFTRNLSVGQGREKTYLKGLSTQSIGRSIPAFLYPDESTVEWYGAHMQKMTGSTHRYIKVYIKTFDLLRNQKKNLSGANFEDHQYFEHLLQFTVKNGVIREEHSFKNRYLKDHDLSAYGLVREDQFREDLQVITNIRKRLEVNNMKYETVADQLIENGICKSKQGANATQMYYLMWMHGQKPDVSRQAFCTHKTRLLQLGIDISIKLDITRAPLRLKNCDIIEVRSVEPPSWYRHPVVPQQNQPFLRLVA